MEHLTADACTDPSTDAAELGYEAGQVGDLATSNPYNPAADPCCWNAWTAAWQCGFEALTAMP